MKYTYLLLSVALLVIFFASKTQAATVTEDLIVSHTGSEDSTHFLTIEAAIQRARTEFNNPGNNKQFRIVIQANAGQPYNAPISSIDFPVTITGTETAKTFITGGTPASFVVNGATATGIFIKNLTFLTATTAISVSNGSSADIANNVFQVGASNTAIQVTNASATVRNNVFYQNGTAINTGSDTKIVNNIFSLNTIAIRATANLTQVTHNDYDRNGGGENPTSDHDSIPNTTTRNTDPLFVDPGNHDFHLKTGSPAIGSGSNTYHNLGTPTKSDMGAYGGPDVDNTAVVVTGVSATANGTTVTVTWDALAGAASYKVYFGLGSTPPFSNPKGNPPSPAPVAVSGTGTQSASLTLSEQIAPTLTKPTILKTSPLNGALSVTWSAVPNATGYRVYYNTRDFTDATLPATFVPVTGGNNTTTVISGLTNTTRYFIHVLPLFQTTYFFSVTALLTTSGVSTETPFSTTANAAIGTETAGPLSDFAEDFPEAAAPFPNLKGEGCFIATAAYGFYSAPQVQALREFRDRYLLTNAPGRAFVAWYYHYGPRGAHFLNLHPWLKAPVRVLLFPLVVGSIFLIYAPPAVKLLTLLLVAYLFARRFYLRKLSPLGGLQ